MTRAQKQSIKERVAEYLNSLESEISQLKEKLQPIESDCCLEDLTRFEMMHEQRIFEKALLLAEGRVLHLHRVYKTIDENEQYGLCELCGDEILFERLLLVPEAKRCVECINE